MTRNATGSETIALLGFISPAGHSTEQNTTLAKVSEYERIMIVINAGDIGTSLAIDVEVATDSEAAGLHTLKSATTLTQAAGDDNSKVVINVRAAELVNPSGASSSNYDYLRVECTPSGTCHFSVEVFGIDSRHEPVPTTLWDQVVA